MKKFIFSFVLAIISYGFGTHLAVMKTSQTDNEIDKGGKTL